MSDTVDKLVIILLLFIIEWWRDPCSRYLVDAPCFFPPHIASMTCLCFLSISPTRQIDEHTDRFHVIEADNIHRASDGLARQHGQRCHIITTSCITVSYSEFRYRWKETSLTWSGVGGMRSHSICSSSVFYVRLVYVAISRFVPLLACHEFNISFSDMP